MAVCAECLRLRQEVAQRTTENEESASVIAQLERQFNEISEQAAALKRDAESSATRAQTAG